MNKRAFANNTGNEYQGKDSHKRVKLEEATDPRETGETCRDTAEQEVSDDDIVSESEEKIIEEDEIIVDAPIIEINEGAYYYERALWFLMPTEDNEESYAEQDSECMSYVYELLHQAVACYYPLAYIELARLYAQGEGQFKNSRKSIELLEKALLLDDKDVQQLAAIQLGKCYEWGHGVDKDVHQAILFYQQAAELGSDVASYLLGRLYYDGVAVAKDLVKARQYLEQAVEEDNDKALWKLYSLYLEINETAKGIDCMQRLIAWGQFSYLASFAALDLAYLYQNGEHGLAVDYNLAFDYFKQAADLGNPLAQWETAGKYLIKLIAGKENLSNLLEKYESYLHQAVQSDFSPALDEINAVEQCLVLADTIVSVLFKKRSFGTKKELFSVQHANQHLQQEAIKKQMHAIIIGTLGSIARLQKVKLADVCVKQTILDSLKQELLRVLSRVSGDNITVMSMKQVTHAWLRQNRYFQSVPISIKSGIFS